MSLRFEEETTVYDNNGDLLGVIESGNEDFDAALRFQNHASLTAEEAREIAKYLESL